MSDQIKLRKDVRKEDTWDLSSLFADENAFNVAVAKLQKQTEEAPSFQGRLGKDADSLLDVLKWYFDGKLTEDSVGNYAFLNWATDGADSANQRRMGIVTQTSTAYEAAVSFIMPEILASSDDVARWIEGDKRFDDYRIAVSKMLRFKQHTLTPPEEKILAMQMDTATTPSDAFQDLADIDIHFKDVEGKPLTQSTFSSFMIDPDRKIRKEAYDNFYQGFEDHKNTITKLYYGSVKQDVFQAKVRNYPSSLEAALFEDKVPVSVYMNLIDAVHNGFPLLHRFYEIKRKALGLDRLAHYDVYVPIVGGVKVNTPFDEAVKVISKALAPLGKDYVDTLVTGLTKQRWVDKYENKGKRSGAFSSGSYIGHPFLLLNYKEDVLRDVFTLGHEGGHSMHSYYSVHSNPFPCAEYTIFEAEVASTFNERLIGQYLLDHAEDDKMKAYIICKQLDDFVATLFRQTMFAEFELKCHQMVESGEPMTVESVRSCYRALLEAYFGPDVELPPQADLEGLRIPHFYRAFYVYKYSTGISASAALSERVLNGGKKELDDYLGFLRSGGSAFPIESLKKAGVDMSTPEPVDAAVKKFGDLMDQLEKLSSF
ncbi:MAG: oligoendopeptidase F [Sphaerochaetaceae bacterium]|nr:oligoendopeptidase F [Sphaerochaetaceae bacterium]MDD4008122.1 oligoendopeptidase F [Sphaerochaetaceae bacterium]